MLTRFRIGKLIASRIKRRCYLLGALGLSLTTAAPISAQTTSYELPDKTMDENGVDLIGGGLLQSFTLVEFGRSVRLKSQFRGIFPEPLKFPEQAFRIEEFYAGAPGAPSDVEVFSTITPLGQAIWRNPPGYETTMPDGRVFQNPAAGRFLTAVYDKPYAMGASRTLLGIYDAKGNKFQSIASSNAGLDRSIVTFADGEVWTIVYQKYSSHRRLRYMFSNTGFFIQYEYIREGTPTNTSQYNEWAKPVRISGASLAHNYCDTSSLAICTTVSDAGNSVTFQYFADGYEMDWASGYKKRFTFHDASFSVNISSPGTNSSIAAFAGGPINPILEPCAVNAVLRKLVKSSHTWDYNYECVQGEQDQGWAVTRIDPVGKQKRLSWSSNYPMTYEIADELGQPWTLEGDNLAGYTGVLQPEGNRIHHTFDSRNNRTSLVVKGKNGGSATQWTASYDVVCANLFTCNQPNSQTDARGNTTTFTYDPVHGAILKKTGPAVNGVTPQTRYEYAQRYAWLKNASGGYSQASSPIRMLVRERFCRTTNPSGSSCAGGTADEVVTDYDYGPDAGPNNLLSRGVAVKADGQTRRTCYGYDQMGRQISETQPAAGLTACP